MYQGQIKKLQKVAGFENVERDVLTWRAIPSTKRYFSYSYLLTKKLISFQQNCTPSDFQVWVL